MAERIAIIFGGQSAEHEISIRSARSVINALDEKRWKAVPIAISTSGQWLNESYSTSILTSQNKLNHTHDVSVLESSLETLKDCFAAFPLIHGKTGEDGKLQGLLEMLNLTYTGSGVEASALGMDKSLSKTIWQSKGLPIARMVVLQKEQLQDSDQAIRAKVANEIGYPCYVKPSSGGSSIGITRVESEENLVSAIDASLHWDDKVLIEEFIDGQEIECAIIGNSKPIAASCLGEISPTDDFYDYDSKYSPDSKAKIFVPARVKKDTANKIRNLAIDAYQAIGCEGFARVDCFVSKDEKIILSEINTIPGFTETSLFPRLWEETGISYSELLTQILELALSKTKGVS